MADRFRTRELDDVVNAYIASRGRAQFLSIAHGLRAIRTLMPLHGISDEQLANMIAAAAIAQGFPISFDGHVDSNRQASARSSHR